MLQNSVLFIRVLCYKYFCFCSLDEELGIKLETQRHPGMQAGACCGVLPMGRIRAVGRQTKAANIQDSSVLMHSNLQSTGHWPNTQTKQTSTATRNSMPTVNKAEKGVAKWLVHHHPTISNITGLLVKSNITTSFWVTVSWNASLFLVHRVFVVQWSITALWAEHLGSSGRSFLRRWKVFPCRCSLIQQGQMRSDFSGTDSTRLQQEAELWKRINKCLKQLYAAEFVNMEYYWILHQVT